MYKTRIAIILLFLITILGCGVIEPNSFKSITVSEIETIMKEKEDVFIYYGQENCGACINMKIILEEILEEKKINIRYLDADKIDDTTILTDNNIVFTPTLISINNGEITKYDQEYDKKSVNKIIEGFEDTRKERVVGMSDIDYKELAKKMEKNVDFILYIGREDCRDCNKFQTVIDGYITENEDVGVYYLDIKRYREKAMAEDAKQSDIDFYESLQDDFFIDWVPSLYHIKNGVIVSKYEYLSKDYYSITDKKERRKAEEEFEQDFIEWMKKIL